MGPTWGQRNMWNQSGFRSHAKRAAELEAQLSAERSENERLRLERDHQVGLARGAQADGLRAQAALDEIQHRLAAAAASEKRAEAECCHAREAVSAAQDKMQQTERTQGSLEGRLLRLEQQLEQERQGAEQALVDAHDRAWALSAEHGKRVQVLIREREDARAKLGALQHQLPLARRIAMARAALLVAAICLGIAGLLLPGLLGVLAGDERAWIVDGFTALSANTPLYLFATLMLLAVLLLAWGLYSLRGIGGQPAQSRSPLQSFSKEQSLSQP